MTANYSPDSIDVSRNNTNGIRLLRRRFMQLAGAASVASLFGVKAVETSSADKFNSDFANPRVQEARKAWIKGFRGQSNRTLGMLCHGLEARHPDLGPWNGIRAIPDGEKGLDLVHENLKRLEVPDDIRFFEGSFGPNAGNTRKEHPFTAPGNVDRVEAHLFARPPFVARGLKLLLETSDGTVIKQFQGPSPHSALAAQINPGKDYVFAVETTFPNNAQANYTLDANYQTDKPNGGTDPFANIKPNKATSATPKVVGWYNEDYELSEATAKPRSGPRFGRGTAIASIMAGSGRASTIDGTTVTQDEPEKILRSGDALTYQVETKPDRGVYGSAFGENIEVEIIGPDGQVLHQAVHGYPSGQSGNNRTNVVVENITVHDVGTKTYKVNIRPMERHSHLQGKSVNQPSTMARVKRVSVGAFKEPATTDGDRTEGDPTLHAGVAPNSGLLGLSGMYKTREDIQHLAEDFAQLFNVRAIHIAFGFGTRPGVTAGKFSAVESIKSLAKAGILPISQTEDIAPASQPDRAAAVADESIMVVETGPHDGIWTGSNSDPGAIDEDGDGAYRKPDVTAPGGEFVPDKFYTTADSGDPFRAEHEQSPIRAYNEQGTVLQAPFVVGTAGLVAQALEEKAPKGIAIPPPSDAGYSDTMRLKQTILATATETPFTAKPWHRREPQYNFGGHDPIEGWGRVNIDTAVEAAARNLTPPGCCKRGENRQRSGVTKIKETVGLDVPRHSRAVAGHVSGTPTVYKASVDFTKYTGENKKLAEGPPHIDLFVYDAENPAKHGTPNIVAKSSAIQGSTTLEFATSHQSKKGAQGGTYYVVAKLVNVPGAANSFDIKAYFDLSVKQIRDLSDA